MTTNTTNSEDPPFHELYNSLFENVPANTDELVDECYKLRYKVYCLEHPFEEPNADVGEYERDAYDGHSVHALLRHRPTGEFIGTVRLILDSKDSPQRMPAVHLSEQHHIFLPDHIYKEPCGEVSRFCISKTFRRRVTDTMYASSYSAREMAALRMRIIPYMALGLIKSVIDICREHDMRQCVAVMEPSLIRLLDNLGIHFLPIGEPIEYHGTRQVTYITNLGLHESLTKERPEVLKLMNANGKSPLQY